MPYQTENHFSCDFIHILSFASLSRFPVYDLFAPKYLHEACPSRDGISELSNPHTITVASISSKNQTISPSNSVVEASVMVNQLE